ncbi:DUF3093 domain-containing protein [Microbacterium sp. A93]|uniref:DUF3093 domain-containing protein n=1 Tax=Microbacterium sp. A93 TaxID=3450716 RepID=UPI003F43F627
MHDSSASAPAAPVLYEEKLRPSPWIWLIAVMISSLSILVFVPIGVEIGLIAAVVVFAIIALLLTVSTPKIVVTERTLQVGRAGIERQHVGLVTGYRGDDATHQRGPALHGLAFMCLRGWIDPVVRIQIDDLRDRTPYWLTSTRNPEQLAEVLGGTMAREADAEDHPGAAA